MIRRSTRRTFLMSSTAAGLALAALPAAVRADESHLSLGFTLYGMKSLPLTDALRVCAEIGYRNVELALMPGYPTEPRLLSTQDRKALRASLAHHNLTVSGLMDNLILASDNPTHDANLEHIKAAADLAHAIDPDHPPIFETILAGKPNEWDEIKQKMVDRARDWARVAAENQITLCLKPHVNSAVNSPERLLWLHRQVALPVVKLCYDYSHFELQGLELGPTLKPLIAETRFIHLKDTAGDAAHVQFLLPGEGRTNYAQYASLLKTFGWSGPVVVEVSAQVFNKPGYNPIAAARSSYAALAPHFGIHAS